MEDLRSQNASLLEEAVEFAGIAQALQIRVAANVLLVDVDVGHGALAVELLESILEVAAFGYIKRGARSDTTVCSLELVGMDLGRKWIDTRTDLIELYDLDGGSKLLEGAFGSLAVRAVALGEDN
jgi:hypothetical protein